MSVDFTNLKEDVSSTAQPRKFPFLNGLDIDKSATNKLALNLNRVLSGSEDVYLTPIGKDNDLDSLLKELDELISSKSDKISKNLMNLEQANRSKFGPRSIATPWVDRKSSLHDYFKRRVSKVKFNPPRQSPNLRPLSVSNAANYLKKNTSSGMPFYTNKGSVIDELTSNFSSYLDRKDPCVLFTRTQEGRKTRNVWGYPVADTLNEMRYYQPLLNHQKKLSWRTALLGPHAVDLAISNTMNRMDSSVDSLISIDFSSFDATVGKDLQKTCFDYISHLFQPNRDLEYIRDRFNTIGIITPDGVIEGSHGVPSGATFTNEVDSLAQYLIVKSTGIECDFQIQGDDGAYLIKDFDIDRLKSAFSDNSLIVNEDKSYVSKEYIVYLQKLYDIYYRVNGFIGGIYPLYRALNRIIYQERYSNFMDYSLKGRDYYSLRTISILENCKYHPLFKEFVGLIYSKDSFKLEFTADGITNYGRMISNGPGTAGLINNQYGDDIKGIKSFETYKLIKQLS